MGICINLGVEFYNPFWCRTDSYVFTLSPSGFWSVAGNKRVWIGSLHVGWIAICYATLSLGDNTSKGDFKIKMLYDHCSDVLLSRLK